VLGQKSYNGVALLSKTKIEDLTEGLPGDTADEHARYIEGVVSTKGGAVRVASIYAPNGNPPDTDKYPYKLRFMERLIARTQGLLAHEEFLVLGGHHNIPPGGEVFFDPRVGANGSLFKLETRRTYRQMLNLGLTDAFRACNAKPRQYTFWDYQAGAWQK